VVVVINPLPELLRNNSLNPKNNPNLPHSASKDLTSSTSTESVEIKKSTSSASECGDSTTDEEETPVQVELTDKDIENIHKFVQECKITRENHQELDEKKLMQFIEDFVNQKKFDKALDLMLRDEVKSNKLGLMREESLGVSFFG
jgi:hypothetical protein